MNSGGIREANRGNNGRDREGGIRGDTGSYMLNRRSVNILVVGGLLIVRCATTADTLGRFEGRQLKQQNA